MKRARARLNYSVAKPQMIWVNECVQVGQQVSHQGCWMTVLEIEGEPPATEEIIQAKDLKLFVLLDSIGLRRETLVRDSLEIGTLRRRKITDYPSLPKSTIQWDSKDVKDLTSWMRTWHEEIRHDQQEFLELFMNKTGCNRSEAKVRTLGIRYGMSENVFNRGKDFPRGFTGDVSLSDFGTLERRLCGNRATQIIVDDYLGPKDL